MSKVLPARRQCHGMFLDIPKLSGNQVGLLKEIVPRLSRVAIFGVPGLNALNLRRRRLRHGRSPSKLNYGSAAPDDFEGALRPPEQGHVEAGILLSSPLVFVSSKHIS